MPSAIRKCRVCGKDYEACRTQSRAVGVFRWQDVACSPECGAVYLSKIKQSRGISEPEKIQPAGETCGEGLSCIQNRFEERSIESNTDILTEDQTMAETE